VARTAQLLVGVVGAISLNDNNGKIGKIGNSVPFFGMANK
jgi:hypothetical protein